MKEYLEVYHYTYSGILKSLIYFYEIQHGDISRANQGIGIVPYVYEKAKAYYYSLFLANSKNIDKRIQDYIPTNDGAINILPPLREPIKSREFSFLDKDLPLNE